MQSKVRRYQTWKWLGLVLVILEAWLVALSTRSLKDQICKGDLFFPKPKNMVSFMEFPSGPSGRPDCFL